MAIYVYGGGSGGGGGITNGAGANVITKSDGTNLVASSLTDDGTNVTQTTNHLFSTDNTLDVGASGATRPRTIYVGTSVVNPLYTAAAGATLAVTAVAPTQGLSSIAGTPLNITAGAATAGSTNAGAAAGGDVTITAGAAAQKTSGAANGGSINLVPGAAVGAGSPGMVVIPDGTVSVPAIRFNSDSVSLAGWYRSAGQVWTFTVGGAGKVNLGGTGVYPAVSNTVDCGFSSLPWRTTYLQTSLQGANTKALTESSATGFCSITTATNDMLGGHIEYTIEAKDGTDLQSRSGVVAFSIVDKAGTASANLSTLGTESFVETAGASTLTNSFDTSISGHVTTIRANATSSLTQTTLQIRYRVHVNGTTTVAAL